MIFSLQIPPSTYHPPPPPPPPPSSSSSSSSTLFLSLPSLTKPPKKTSLSFPTKPIILSPPIQCHSPHINMDIDMIQTKEGIFTPKQTKVVVLWDLDNKPPRGPPYDAALSLKSLAARFGDVVEISAYANRHAFSHLPTRVLEERRERKRLDVLERKGILTCSPDAYVCTVCGRKCRTNIELKKHFKQLHERERQKKLSRMKQLKGKKRQRFKERYLDKNVKFEEAARNLIMPKVGYGLAKELRRAGVYVKTVEDKPQAADWAVKRQMMHSMSRGVDWLLLVSDDSDFREMLGKAREANLGTVVVGDRNGALGAKADMWVSWIGATVDVFTALVSAYGTCGLFDQAFSITDDMKSVYDCKPDVYTYSILLSCCVKHHRFDLVNQIFAEMSYLGIECSAITYNTVIDGYGKAKLFDMMESLLCDMIDSGACRPDVFTMNSFISGYGNCGQIEKMERSYEEFQLMGISPDVRTFNILIRSYGRAGMYQKMESVLEFMRKRFFSPSVVTFNTVIDVFGRAGNIEKMDEVFLKMKHQGMKPNSITYCSLVDAYSNAGKLFRVESILRQIENSNVVLDTTFFNCVISAYGRAGNIDQMNKLFLEMKEKNCEPDYITFATMTQAYNANGMTEAAENIKAKILSMQTRSGLSLSLCKSFGSFHIYTTFGFADATLLNPLTKKANVASKRNRGSMI